MYNSISAVMFTTAILLAISDQVSTIREQFVLTVMAFGMAYRGYEGLGTFDKCVRSFYMVATLHAPKSPA